MCLACYLDVPPPKATSLRNRATIAVNHPLDAMPSLTTTDFHILVTLLYHSRGLQYCVTLHRTLSTRQVDVLVDKGVVAKFSARCFRRNSLPS